MPNSKSQTSLAKRRKPISTAKILTVNIAGQAVALATGKIFGAIASIALIRYLGVEKQGVYSYVISLVYLFSFITDFGLVNMLTREIRAGGFSLSIQGVAAR